MRTLGLVVAVLVLAGASGCRRRVHRVMVVNTPEGQECRRQCMVVYSACEGGRRRNAKRCHLEENDCLRTCPGAIYEQ